jgi:ribonuclease G
VSVEVEPPPAEEEETAAEEAAEETAEGEEEPAAGAAEGTEPEGIEPARMPQSLTATLRAQGGRLPHRISRRMRRRRGERGPEGEAGQPAPIESAPEPVEVRQESRERPERRERDRDRDRDRDREPRADRPPMPSIADLLKEGQEIIVQIAKEPLGQKGARITSHIAMPGRYVVYMPTVEHLGVSRKVSTEDERQRLKRILQRHREGVQGGYIMRTAGEGRSEEEIAADMRYLAELWLEIRQKAEKRRAPALLHHDIEVVQRIIRDQLSEGFKSIWVDNEELYEQVLHAVERMQPNLLAKVKLYTRPEPIFEAFGVTQELEKALRPKVWLKSGGYIVINQTEALVAIDVNTGKYVGKSNRLEDTIVKTNTEAVKEIVRQVRLRDLGGIIVVDFIDMDERKNRQKVMQALEEAMRADKAPYKILQFNDFGLVAITRKRVKQSLERALCEPCPACEGAGYMKSVQTVIGEITTQAQKYAKVVDTKDVVLRVSPEVARTLKSVENQYLEELEEILGRPVLVTADPQLIQEKFDLT